jgi:LEA14-like dessication related protein
MANGTKSGVSVPQGESTVPLSTVLANERIPPWWVSHVRNGERTALTVNADVHSSLLGAAFGAPEVTRTVETDILSAFNSTASRPVGSSPTGGPALYINETGAAWGDADSSRTEIAMRFVVYNPNTYPIPVSELGYETGMNGVEMGSGATEEAVVIPPGERREIRATTTLRNDRLDEWWVTHLENDQTTELRIDFSARIELPTGTVEIPLDPLTYTETVETDIFGTKEGDEGDTQATGGGDGTEGTATQTPTPEDDSLLGGAETATPGGGDEGTATPAQTPTPTPTQTPTPTPTPTDDGLLGGDNTTDEPLDVWLPPRPVR